MVVRGMFVNQTAARWWWSMIRGGQIDKVHEMDSVLDSCIADDLVEKRQRDDGTYLIKASVKGEGFCSPSDLLQALLSKYDRVWMIILLPLITFAITRYGERITDFIAHHLR